MWDNSSVPQTSPLWLLLDNPSLPSPPSLSYLSLIYLGHPEDDAGWARGLRVLTGSPEVVSQLPVWCQREFTVQTRGHAQSRHGEARRCMKKKKKIWIWKMVAHVTPHWSHYMQMIYVCVCVCVCVHVSVCYPRGASWCATASWWMRARGNTACVTSSSTLTSCCAPDTNMRAEGELRRERKHVGNVVYASHARQLAPHFPLWTYRCMMTSKRGLLFICVSSRKPDSYRFCWYLPLAGLKLRWVAEQERSQDTHLRLHAIRAKMYLFRQQLQQHKAVCFIDNRHDCKESERQCAIKK